MRTHNQADNDSGDAHSGLASAIQVVISLEASQKWPRSVEAFRAAKLAMMLRMAKCLRRDKALLEELRFVGVCPETDDVLAAPRLRIAMGGFAFIIRLAPPKNAVPNGAALTSLDDDDAASRVAVAHHAAVRALSAANRAYAATVRLVARWLDAQLLSRHVPHEVVEVLVGCVFSPRHCSAVDACCDGDGAPGSALRGFLAALRLLCVTDWKKQPLYFAAARAAASTGSSTPESAAADDRYVSSRAGVAAAARARAPTRAMFVVADYFGDDRGEPMPPSPNAGVEAPVLRLITSAAREALQAAAAALFADVPAPAPAWLEATFGRSGGAATRGAWHATVCICKKFVARGSMRLDDADAAAKCRNKGPKALGAAYANLGGAKRKRHEHPRVLIGAEPVAAYVARLQHELGRFALFFFDEQEPDAVGVVFRAKAFHAAPFSAADSARALPVKGGKVLPNILEILHDVKRLGTGLVERVDLHD